MAARRLTLVVSSLQCGGVERVVSMMANYWAGRGDSVTVITFDNGSNPPFFELDSAVHHQRIRDSVPRSFFGKTKRLFSRVKSLRAAIHRSKPDIVISHGEFMNILTGAACSGLPAPIVLTEHSVPGNIQLSFGMRMMRNISYSTARSLVVLNAGTAEYFTRWAAGRIAVIPNPIIPPPAELDIPPHASRPAVILGMGRLSPEKGFDRLIRAFAAIEDLSWSLTIWGEGPMRRELENLIGALHLDERVKLPGLTQAPYSELAKGSIFVLPSRVEGFGNVICEAMAAGCAVVSFDCPTGPRSIITDQEDGILVPDGDIEALSGAIAELTRDPARRQRLANSARRDVTKYSQDAVMLKWEAILESAGLKK